MSKLRDRLEEFKTTFESGSPPYNATPEVVATMHRATAELKASGIENTALKVGDRAPDFSLFNQDHVEVASRIFFDNDRWSSASSEDTGDLTALWSWRLYKRLILRFSCLEHGCWSLLPRSKGTQRDTKESPHGQTNK
jgi:hypothetical protein